MGEPRQSLVRVGHVAAQGACGEFLPGRRPARSLWFVAGLTQASDAPDAEVVTSAVTASFAFGWQMARLYTGPLSSAAEPSVEEDLPGLSALPAAQLVNLGLLQADAALGRLKTFLGGVQLPTTAAVRAAADQGAPGNGAVRKAILDLHVALLVQLTAADYRLGKAYGLGRALADTCASAHGDDTQRRQALVRHLEPHRALVIVGWLDDLRTVLPAHAGHGVADSLERWECWAAGADLATLNPAAVNGTTQVLHRCGQRWRAILSGEKDATDLLQIGDYVTAARGTLAQAAAIARALAVRLWVPLTVAAVLIGAGIWLIIANHSSAQVLAGLGTIAGGLGITWRSAAGVLGHLSVDLVRPLWGAQIDAAVATQLTPAPQRDCIQGLQRPRRRWSRAWRELRTVDPETLGGTSAQLAPGRPAAPQKAGNGQAADTAVPEADPASPDSANEATHDRG